MIRKKDISDFFDLEAEAAKKSWEALMSLPVKDRIRKRKAIDSVFLKRFESLERNEDNKIKLSISFEKINYEVPFRFCWYILYLRI